MSLSQELISEFVKMTKDDTPKKNETIAYGTVVKSDGLTYVKLDGAEVLTPVITTTNVADKERVTVMIKNHTAVITGNITSPAARTGDVEEVGEEVSAIKADVANVKILMADKVSTTELEAQIAKIDTLESDNVTINEKLTAAEADISTIKSDNVDISERLTAAEADISKLDVDSLSATYANIDFSNIGKAAMEYFYAQSGLIENVTIGDSTITGNLVGVTIKGDLIEGGTVVAEKLVIKGTDGLYYKLNTDGVTTETEQTEYNSLNGSIITAKSITATKISVEDLVAFGATIGGFHITDDSIYSGVKESVDNTTRGIYLDNDGQVAFGDSNNFLKFYKDSDGSYKLVVSANSIIFGASNKNLEDTITDIDPSIQTVEGTFAQANCKEGTSIHIFSELEPKQDLTYGNPYPAGEGKNLFTIDAAYNSKDATIAQIGDVTRLICNGSYSTVRYDFNLIEYEKVAGKTLTLSVESMTPSAENKARIIFGVRLANDTAYSTIKAESAGVYKCSVPTDVTDASFIYMIVYGNYNGTANAGDYVDYGRIQLEIGSEATDYAPYSNECPIEGWTELNAAACGKNHFSGWVTGENMDSSTGDFITIDTSARTDYIAVNPSVQMCISGLTDTLYSHVAYYDADKNFIGISEASATTAMTFTVPDGCYYISIGQYEDSNVTGVISDLSDMVQIEVGSESTDYESYNGGTYTLKLGDAIYGGNVDWNAGLMNVTWGLVELDGIDENWKKPTTQPVSGKVRYDGAIVDVPTSTGNDCVCSHYTYKGVNADGIWLLSTPTKGISIRIISSLQTVDEFKAYLADQAAAGTPVQIAYKLAEPYTVKLTPQYINTLKGLNTVYTNVDYGRIEFGHDMMVNIITTIETTQDTLSSKQAELEAEQKNVATYLSLDGDTVRVGKEGVTSEFLIDPWGAGVSINKQVFSRFESDRVRFGNMEMRKPATVGGLAFDSIADIS